jgi:hypothetical protein
MRDNRDEPREYRCDEERSICKEKMDCTMMSKVSIFISVKTVFTTMPKKAVASIQAGFLATKTVCVSIIPTGPKQTKGVNLDA